MNMYNELKHFYNERKNHRMRSDEIKNGIVLNI